jgi:hypothetical protein
MMNPIALTHPSRTQHTTAATCKELATQRRTSLLMSLVAALGISGVLGPSITQADDEVPACAHTILRDEAAVLFVQTDVTQEIVCAARSAGRQMRIIAFLTAAPAAKTILGHLREPTTPPEVARAPGPPLWDPVAEPAPVGMTPQHPCPRSSSTSA